MPHATSCIWHICNTVLVLCFEKSEAGGTKTSGNHQRAN
jgi:hypothetical protein